MPELPEVQTVVNELGERLVGQRFAKGAEVLWERTIGYPDAADFVTRLAGRLVTGVRRRAKFILVDLHTQEVLAVHLRMTGTLHFADATDPPQPHLRVRLPLHDGTELRFIDMRKFGRLYLGTEAELATVIPLGRLGPEPLEAAFTVDTLQDALAGRRGAIKVTLLNQEVVAGLGNIYIDEAL